MRFAFVRRRMDWPMVAMGAVFAAVLFLIAWGIFKAITAPDRGEVIGHSHHDAYTSCTVKPVSCTNYAEKFCLVLRDGDNEGEKCVSEREYNEYRVGDYYPRPR